MQTSLFKKMMEAHYYTATVDSSSMAGQVSHQVVRSSSPRQVMRFAARISADHAPAAEINVYRHMNGHDPMLVAKRLVADRFWNNWRSTSDPPHAVPPLSDKRRGASFSI